MLISCDIIRDLLPGYADSVCSEDTKELVEAHCEGCEECRERLAAMREPLPVKRDKSVPKNPMKKARRHYIKLAAITALCFILIAAPFVVIFGISLNEQLQGWGASWSSIAAKNEMNSVGRLIMKGNYEAAFDRVGFIGADGQAYNGSEVDFMREAFSEHFGDFFGKHPVTGVESDGHLYGGTGIVKGYCTLSLDENTTERFPFAVQIAYERRNGQIYINKFFPIINTSEQLSDSDRAEELWYVMSDQTEIYNYPGTNMITGLDSYLSGERRSENSIFYTREQMEIMKENADAHTKLHDDMTPEELAQSEESGKKYIQYTEERSKAASALFQKNYRYISLSGGDISYCSEPIFEGLMYEHFQCYRQPVTVYMETLSGEKFTVSFVMKHNSAIECPLENIAFSDNAPEDFCLEFERLFG